MKLLLIVLKSKKLFFHSTPNVNSEGIQWPSLEESMVKRKDLGYIPYIIFAQLYKFKINSNYFI